MSDVCNVLVICLLFAVTCFRLLEFNCFCLNCCVLCSVSVVCVLLFCCFVVSAFCVWRARVMFVVCWLLLLSCVVLLVYVALLRNCVCCV